MSATQAIRTDGQRVAARTVILASADAEFRQRLNVGLTGLRWLVREASGGADAMAQVEKELPEAIVIDGWLPDLEVSEFAGQMALLYPAMDVLRADGSATRGFDGSLVGAKSPRRNEILHVLRAAQDAEPNSRVQNKLDVGRSTPASQDATAAPAATRGTEEIAGRSQIQANERQGAGPLPEMVGDSASMLELAAMIRLVAPRNATVLIEGETGTGKEVVAKALHRLSARAGKPFVVLNCAAIPESLLEAELFGHTRGAFTGAVQSRTGRIEAAHGGTLFLDEIGEMPLALQAKMLRFLECGELQRVGDNETTRVDVRVIAATHQPLEQRSEERTFRLDLYHRLAVFPLEVPPLRERMEDLPQLVEFFLDQMGREMPRKTISANAMEKLRLYAWPGNVRELMHVLERAAILSADRPEIGVVEVRLGRARR